MKKKLKNLNFNKIIISKLELNNIHGGIFWPRGGGSGSHDGQDTDCHTDGCKDPETKHQDIYTGGN